MDFNMLKLEIKQPNFKTDYKKNYLELSEIFEKMKNLTRKGRNKLSLPSKMIRDVDLEKLYKGGFTIKKSKNKKKITVKWRAFNNITDEKLTKLENRIKKLETDLNETKKKVEIITGAITSIKK